MNTENIKETDILLSRNGCSMYLTSDLYHITINPGPHNFFELSFNTSENGLSLIEENSLLKILCNEDGKPSRLDKLKAFAEFSDLKVAYVYRQTVTSGLGVWEGKVVAGFSYCNAVLNMI